MDPRRYQIAALAALLAYGLFWLRFDLQAPIVATLLTVTLATQWVCWRAVFSSNVDFKSALISALSLCLLFRTTSPLVAAAAAFVTIASKFTIRVRGRHIFNPTNIGIVALLLLTPNGWVSPGQWGDTAFFAFLVACIGLLVVTRAARADVTFAFILSYAALLIGRSAWLGEPMAIPLHRLQSGAFLIFAFFMISDPKTTPDSRLGRVLFAALVALGAYYVHFKLFRTNGLLWSLAACAPLVPLIDRLLGGFHVETGVPAFAPVTSQDLRPVGAGGGGRLRVAGAAGGLLRLLRRARRHEALQPRLAGRARP